MSGLEVLGAAAAALQLVEASGRLIIALNHIRKKMKDAPNMLSDGITSIKEMKTIAETVRTHPAFKDDDDIKDILLCMKQKAEELEKELMELTPEIKDGDSRFVKSICRHHKNFKAVKNHDRIEDLLEYLERKKSTLSLQISIVSTAVQDRIATAVMDFQPSPAVSVINIGGPHYHIPYDRNPNFTGRKDVMANLMKRIDAKEQRISIFGLGGIGKTNVMLALAKEVEKAEATSIFWVSGDNRDKFGQDCQSIIQKLPIPGINPASDARVVMKTCLESSNVSRWLLLIDNVDDEEVFFEMSGTGLHPDALANFMPTTSNGTIIFTTRNRKVAVQLNSKLVHLSAMDRIDAVEMLKSHLEDDYNDDYDSSDSEKEPEDGNDVEADMIELVSELEYIPLAISQAAAYIKANSNTVCQYLKLLKSRGDDGKIDWLDRNDFNDSTRPSGSVNPIFRTWALSLSRIEKKDEGAANSLFFMSCIGRQNIPEFLLPVAVDPAAANEALGTLKAYSFIKQGRTNKLIDIHRLVHLVTREYIRQQGKLEIWTQEVVNRLSDFVPAPRKQDMATLSKLLPHVYLVAQRHQKPTDELKIGTLYYNASYAFRLAFQFYKAAELALWDWNDKSRRLGEDDPATHVSAINYAEMISPVARFVESEQILRCALEGLSKYRDSNDLDIILGRCKLANLQGFMDSSLANKAEIELDALVADAERLLGPNDLEVANVLFYLGDTCINVGKFEKGETMTRRALNIYEREVGPGHGWAVLARMELARELGGLGRHEEAKKLMERNLEIFENPTGNENRTMKLVMTSSIVHKVFEQGDKAAGRILLEKALEDFKEPEQNELQLWHAWSQLAECLLALERFAEAESIYERVLAFYKQLLDNDHRRLYRIMATYAMALHGQKKFDSAIPLYKDVVALLETVPTKFVTDKTCWTLLELLIEAYKGSGEKEEELKLRRQTYEKRMQILGDTSEATILECYWVGIGLDALGKTEEAEIVLREATVLILTHLGASHSYYIPSSGRLADILRRRGRTADEEAVRRDILKQIRGTKYEKDAKSVPGIRRCCKVILRQERTDDVQEYLDWAFRIVEETDMHSTQPEEVLKLNKARDRLLAELSKRDAG